MNRVDYFSERILQMLLLHNFSRRRGRNRFRSILSIDELQQAQLKMDVILKIIDRGGHKELFGSRLALYPRNNPKKLLPSGYPLDYRAQGSRLGGVLGKVGEVEGRGTY